VVTLERIVESDLMLLEGFQVLVEPVGQHRVREAPVHELIGHSTSLARSLG
jgi:hypothetical protein